MEEILKNKSNKCSKCQSQINQKETLAYYKHVTRDRVTNERINDIQRLYMCNNCFNQNHYQNTTAFQNIKQCKCGLYIPQSWKSYHEHNDCLVELQVCQYCKHEITRYEHNMDKHNCSEKLLSLIQDQSVKILCLENKVSRLEKLLEQCLTSNIDGNVSSNDNKNTIE